VQDPAGPFQQTLLPYSRHGVETSMPLIPDRGEIPPLSRGVELVGMGPRSW